MDAKQKKVAYIITGSLALVGVVLLIVNGKKAPAKIGAPGPGGKAGAATLGGSPQDLSQYAPTAGELSATENDIGLNNTLATPAPLVMDFGSQSGLSPYPSASNQAGQNAIGLVNPANLGASSFSGEIEVAHNDFS